MQPWRDDTVGGPRHPARIGRTPVDILRVQIKHIGSGRPVGVHRLVDMDHPFGHPCRSAGKVQQRHILGIRVHDLEFIRSLFHQFREGEHLFIHILFRIDQKYVTQVRKCFHLGGDLLLIEALCRQQTAGITALHTLQDRFGPEL